MNHKPPYSSPNRLILAPRSSRPEVQAVQEWIANNVTDSEEQLVLYCSYQLGLTPREIVKQYSDDFQNVGKIYHIKERVLKRAKRSFYMNKW